MIIIYSTNQIKRKPQYTLFSTIKPPLLPYILNYLPLSDWFEFRKVNKQLSKAFDSCRNPWLKELHDLAHQYHFKVCVKDIDESRAQAAINKRAYLSKAKDGLYLRIKDKGERIIALFNSLDLTYLIQQNAWKNKLLTTSLYGGPSIYLNSSTTVNLEISIGHIKADNYTVSLYHGLDWIEINCLTLTVFIDSVQVYKTKYPTKVMKENYDYNLRYFEEKSQYLCETVLCRIKQGAFSKVNSKKNNDEEHEIEIKLKENDKWSKGGLYPNAFIIDRNVA